MKHSFLPIIILAVVSVFVVASMATAVKGPGATVPQGRQYAQHKTSHPVNAVGAHAGPAMRAQASLEAAASSPAGNGKRVDKPAAKVVGGKRQVKPSQVLPDPRTGISINGCLLGYGIPGEECVPVHAGLGPKLPRD